MQKCLFNQSEENLYEKKQSEIEKFAENIKKLINYFKSEELSDEKFNELLVRRNKINLSNIE